jgi:hypothetical protein
MGHFTQSLQKTIPFDGEEVRFTMRRMQNKHMLILAPILAADPGENRLARTARLVDAAKGILAECITDWQGPKDATGAPVPLATAQEESYFLPLMDAVLGELLKDSVMKEADAKKSDATPPAASSAENASQEPSPES